MAAMMPEMSVKDWHVVTCNGDRDGWSEPTGKMRFFKKTINRATATTTTTLSSKHLKHNDTGLMATAILMVAC